MSQNGTQEIRDEAQRLIKAIRCLVRRFSVSERADVSCCGMTVAQAATLEVLKLEGAMGLSVLGRRLGISPSTLSRNLQRLEERGLVQRIANPDDARAAIAALTPDGERAAGELEEREIRSAGAILDRLSPDRRVTVVQGLEDLLGAIREATESCCSGAYDHLIHETGEPTLADRSQT